MISLRAVHKAMAKARDARVGARYISIETAGDNRASGFRAFLKRQAVQAERRLKRTIEKQFAA